MFCTKVIRRTLSVRVLHHSFSAFREWWFCTEVIPHPHSSNVAPRSRNRRNVVYPISKHFLTSEKCLESGENKKCLETGEHEKCPETGENKECLDTGENKKCLEQQVKTTGKKCPERYKIQHFPLRAERRRHEARREMFTLENRTLPTILPGRASQRPAWA